MNRTVCPDGAKVVEFTTGPGPGLPAPTNKPYGLLFSGKLIFHQVIKNPNEYANSNFGEKRDNPRLRI